MPPVRLEPATPRSRVKHSTAEPLCSSFVLAVMALDRLCVGTGLSEPFKMYKIIYFLEKMNKKSYVSPDYKLFTPTRILSNIIHYVWPVKLGRVQVPYTQEFSHRKSILPCTHFLCMSRYHTTGLQETTKQLLTIFAQIISLETSCIFPLTFHLLDNAPPQLTLTGLIQSNLCKIQGLLKGYPTDFKGSKSTKNTN